MRTDVKSLGRCCCCGGTERVRNIVCLPRRAPIPGTGWGCGVCGLPQDGAVYVACDRCLEANAPALEVVVGRAASGNRIGIETLADTVFEHDMSRHPEMVS